MANAQNAIEETAPEGMTPWQSAEGDSALDRPSDWGSLVADLSKGSGRPSWRVHDRTHIEFAIDYLVRRGAKRSDYEWEAYFFIPESLRIDEGTYAKQDIYLDLQSYVRFAVPDARFGEVAGAPITALREVVAKGKSAAIMRELRLFACQVRASGVAARRAITDALDDEHRRSTGLAATARMVTDARRITEGLRDVIAALPPSSSDTVVTAAKWVDEDVSRIVETLLGDLAVRLDKAGAPEALRASVVQAAVNEARYREAAGLEGVGRTTATKRDVEHLEFRRHVLKRFTSSVLWLEPEVRDGAKMALHVLYAIAAGVAMAFAVLAALLNGDPRFTDELWMWALAAVIAYMGKDRIKAWLQERFSKVVSRHLPDRRWRIEDSERGVVLGKADEQSAFVPFEKLPKAVLAKRRSTRKHPLEEQARPESVLWHRKVVRLRPSEVAKADPRFDAITEIFRLDLRRWLAHTDDPKRKIVFADPVEERVCSAMAPRVYNIGVVYRLRGRDETNAPWHRLRVVVSRKGIRRIDTITG